MSLDKAIEHNKEEKDDNYWKGYIQKQKEAEEICKMCNYRNKYKEAREILDKVTDKLKKMKQSIDKLKNRDGESMLMVDVCIQNIIAFYDDIEKLL